jgi:Tfp pilus assembly protein PilF
VKQILGAPLREDHSRVLCFLSITRQLRIDKKNQEAVDLLNLLVEVMPNYYFIHSELAFVLLDLERYPESIKEHEITLATNPGVSKYASAATQEAFEAALKATPPTDYDRNNLAGYYDNLAFMYSKTNQEAKAMAALERSAATKPSIGAYQNLAAMYQRANKMDSAIVVLEKALALEPQNVDVMKALATLAFNTNQPDRAREYFKKAASVKGDDADIHLNLGVVLFNTKQPKEAAVEFAEAARLRPDSPEILYYLGIAQFESGDKKGADTTLKKVVELKPDYADAYRYLGNIAFEKKDYKNAEKYYALEDKYKGKKK